MCIPIVYDKTEDDSVGSKGRKIYFEHKCHGHSLKFIDRCMDWKVFIIYAKYEVSILDGSKVIAKFKVDNRQTKKQTNRQTEQNWIPPNSIQGT